MHKLFGVRSVRMEIPYTICFIRRNEEVLMLYRMKSQNLHKRNGVGGKIEVGEDPLQSVQREVWEETGLTVTDLSYRGVVSWNGISGMHVYRADHFSGEVTVSEEGPLEWKKIQWIQESKETVSNIPIFLHHLLNEVHLLNLLLPTRMNTSLIMKYLL
jgi:8-oxo-dGTP diphosphatase